MLQIKFKAFYANDASVVELFDKFLKCKRPRAGKARSQVKASKHDKQTKN